MEVRTVMLMALTIPSEQSLVLPVADLVYSRAFLSALAWSELPRGAVLENLSALMLSAVTLEQRWSSAQIQASRKSAVILEQMKMVAKLVTV
jgi:hypothetical protein